MSSRPLNTDIPVAPALGDVAHSWPSKNQPKKNVWPGNVERHKLSPAAAKAVAANEYVFSRPRADDTLRRLRSRRLARPPPNELASDAAAAGHPHRNYFHPDEAFIYFPAEPSSLPTNAAYRQFPPPMQTTAKVARRSLPDFPLGEFPDQFPRSADAPPFRSSFPALTPRHSFAYPPAP